MPNMFDVVNAVRREIEPRGCEILHTHTAFHGGR